ncbi:MAG: hypothetical protein AAGC74_00235 [Verrucomicrobiota bacterium]
MDAVIIKQNRSNSWTAFGILLALVLLTVSAIGIVAAWPISLSFEWFLLPLLFIGSLVLGANYVYWMLSPRETAFSVSPNQINIEDQPVFRRITRSFEPSDVVEIVYNSESSSYLRTGDGKRHLLSDILMMKRDAIFLAVSKFHPEIQLTENN